MSDLTLHGDLEKDIPVKPPEIVTPADLKLERAEEPHTTTATMYHNRLFTVIPKQFDITQGILPADQGFSNKYVILWDTYRDLVEFNPDRWKKVMVEIDPVVKRTDLVKLPGAAYALPSIPDTWRITEEKDTPQYVE